MPLPVGGLAHFCVQPRRPAHPASRPVPPHVSRFQYSFCSAEPPERPLAAAPAQLKTRCVYRPAGSSIYVPQHFSSANRHVDCSLSLLPFAQLAPRLTFHRPYESSTANAYCPRPRERYCSRDSVFPYPSFLISRASRSTYYLSFAPTRSRQARSPYHPASYFPPGRSPLLMPPMTPSTSSISISIKASQ